MKLNNIIFINKFCYIQLLFIAFKYYILIKIVNKQISNSLFIIIILKDKKLLISISIRFIAQMNTNIYFLLIHNKLIINPFVFIL